MKNISEVMQKTIKTAMAYAQILNKEKELIKGFCKDNPNCNYKQLKRKEQECEKYKKCINNIKIINKDLLNDLCDNCGWHNTDGCDPEDFVCGKLIQIKQTISEVTK